VPRLCLGMDVRVGRLASQYPEGIRSVRQSKATHAQKSLAIVTFQAHTANAMLTAKLKAIPFHGICPRIR
jgi:hypothetical protein